MEHRFRRGDLVQFTQDTVETIPGTKLEIIGFSGVWVLIYNVGYGHDGSGETITDEYGAIIEINRNVYNNRRGFYWVRYDQLELIDPRIMSNIKIKQILYGN